jgi:hypothetical protein
MKSLLARVTFGAVATLATFEIAAVKDTRPPYSIHMVMHVQPNAPLVQPGPIGLAQTVRITEQRCTGTVLEQNRPPGLGCDPAMPATTVEARIVTANCPVRVTMTQPGTFSITRFGSGGNVTLSAPQRPAIRGLCEIEFRDGTSHAFATLLI